MDELCSAYIKSNQAEAKEAILKEQENFESDGHLAVEKAQQVIKEYLSSISKQGHVSGVVNVSPTPTVEASHLVLKAIPLEQPQSMIVQHLLWTQKAHRVQQAIPLPVQSQLMLVRNLQQPKQAL
jgi:hypothetical protein